MMKEITIDIHGMVVYDALKLLEKEIANVKAGTKSIRVIHGYRGGQGLKEMVRDANQLRSKRIKRRKLTLNQGETLLELYDV